MGTRLRPQKSGTPALSEPGLSALFWSTVLSGAQIFFSTFFCVQNHNTMRAVRADRLDFRAEKRPKRPNLSGQAGDTLTHLKALILIHNTSKKKMVPATCLDFRAEKKKKKKKKKKGAPPPPGFWGQKKKKKKKKKKS